MGIHALAVTDVFSGSAFRTGGDIIFMAKLRSLAKDPETNEDKLSSIWRHVDDS